MEFLSKLFPRWIAPKKQTDLALGLEDYVQKLKVGAIFASGLEEAMLTKFKKDGTFTDLEHTDIGLKPHAQFFVLNLICQACVESGLDDSDQTFGIVMYVMNEALWTARQRTICCWAT